MNGKPVIYNYEVSPRYTEFRVDSVWGVVSSAGELEVYLCEDVFPLPNSIKVIPSTDPNTPPRQEQDPDYNQLSEINIRRVCHARVIIPIKVLPSIIEWLQSKVEEYKKMEPR
ncbi:hypothetical protein SAMN00808754_2085 [Thermanaeromonas toyohensis ToBE]|uniref:Uncharacterized protein n=1 Tax=Thermanaeromonas toyohensis ToBE TaxID=698762 RepID=A0A1W1VXB5_9FIRM|nr:hypothetical protein [Thermanaeromonas toyohensis]SMB98029.1 hypothetical protein SAMN00808754_2085 [Thermanaeromonas toyohensis ToBE]